MRSLKFPEVPYIVHTNRELGLMLKGVKPVAIFGDARDNFPECVVRYLRMFDRYVRAGRFTRRDIFVPIEHPKFDRVHRIYFTLPGEEWRVDALIELFGGPRPWTDAMERRFGELLGYTDEQNDWWIAHCATQRALSQSKYY